MERGRCQQHKAISRKRKQEHKGIDGANKKHWSDNGGIDKLADDVLINILSHMSPKEAARASVLAHRWRYLWRSALKILIFHHRDTASENVTGCKKFASWANTVSKIHQGRHIEGIVLNFDAGRDEFSHRTSNAVTNLVYFATHRKVQMFEVKLLLYDGYCDRYEFTSYHNVYEFPSVRRLISHSNGVSSPFCHLRALRLVHVGIKDEVVHYFLASCPSLEELFLQFSYLLKNVRVVDPPSLRVLEISRCLNIQSLEISAVNLVSLTYEGGENSLLLKKIPNIRELTIISNLCLSFVLEPKKHWSYSDELEKLVLDIRKLDHMYRRLVAPPDLPQLCSLKWLELKAFTLLGRRLLFTPLIKA